MNNQATIWKTAPLILLLAAAIAGCLAWETLPAVPPTAPPSAVPIAAHTPSPAPPTLTPITVVTPTPRTTPTPTPTADIVQLTVQPIYRPPSASTNTIPIDIEIAVAPFITPTVAPTATHNLVAGAPVSTDASPTPFGVTVREDTVTLNSYGWQDALLPSDPSDPIYPYPRLNFDAVSAPAPRTYQAVFVQNDYAEVVILPELGGRIISWTDRTTNRRLTYANPVLKPTRWGYRGWWLASGGLEWAFPTNEHGLNEYRPWQYELLGGGVRVWDVDDRSGLRVEVTIQLEPDTNRLSISPRVSNPTERAQSYQFWSNAMLTLSDSNAPSADLTFVLPAQSVVLHSTGDGTLPEPGGSLDWPLHNGRDFSRYAEWHSYLGVFAPQAAQVGFAAAYDLGSEQGIVRTAPAWVQGVKIFGLGDLPSNLWTDDGSRYFELWGGLTSTFWDSASLNPGQEISWNEYWYPVSGMGGLSWAGAEGAVRLTPLASGVDLAVETVRPLQASIVLTEGPVEVQRWSVAMGPGEPFRVTWPNGDGPWGLEVVSANGATLIHVGP